MIYQLKQRFPTNFINMIIGRSTLNIGDSFYLIAFSYAIVQVYHVSAADLATLTLLSRLPIIFSFVFSSYLNKIHDKKRFLIFLQMIHIAIISIVILVFLMKAPVHYLFVLNTLFYFINTLSNATSSGIVPQSLNYEAELIEKSVDVQYFATNSLDIISNFIGSLLLLIVTYPNLMIIGIVVIFIGLYFIQQLHLSNVMSPASQTEGRPQSFSAVHVFLTNKLTSFVVLVEAFLSGATDLLLTLTPLYLLQIDVDLAHIGLVYGARRLADLIGALLAPRVKINHKQFFYIDYILSGTLLALIFIVDNIVAKFVFYILAFIIIGVSGNIFEKMIYASYPPTELAGIYSIISSLFSLFGVLFLLVPNFYSDIYVLGIVFNMLTVVIGIILFMIVKISDKKVN
ncbi:MFS transporter [Aerococcaceae bacterium zg-BR22]|uniref:MFS transporter n=1 Tax=Aerococcaceae bacterium zg-1292 TaxID=2774330 RepID=UPI00406420EC|nr:MFS transporter [Aerococcaceae bacterium zg-BR22]